MDRRRLFDNLHNQYARLRQALRYLRTPAAADYPYCLLYRALIALRRGAIACSAYRVARLAGSGRRWADGPDPGRDCGCLSPRERGRYQFYISAVWAISSLYGPLVGGFVARNLSRRWIFRINLPIGAVALLVCNNALRRLSPIVHVGMPRLDILGMFLLAGAISVLLLALGWGGNVYP